METIEELQARIAREANSGNSSLDLYNSSVFGTKAGSPTGTSSSNFMNSDNSVLSNNTLKLPKLDLSSAASNMAVDYMKNPLNSWTSSQSNPTSSSLRTMLGRDGKPMSGPSTFGVDPKHYDANFLRDSSNPDNWVGGLSNFETMQGAAGIGQLGLGIMSYLDQKKNDKMNRKMANQTYANNAVEMANRDKALSNVNNVFGTA